MPDEILVVTNPPADSPSLLQTTIASIQEKINTATVTVENALNNAETAVAALLPTPDMAKAVASNQDVIQSVETATAKVEEAHIAISDAETATAAIPTAATLVDSATAVVAATQSTVDSATAVVSNTQATVIAAMEALPALAAATDCVEGSACVNFYNLNAELGPIHDQIIIAQNASDAAVQAAADAIVANQAAEDALNTHTPIVIAAQEANAVARDANDAAQAVLVDATQAVAVQQTVVNTDAQAVSDAQSAATASAAPGLNVTVYASYQGGAAPSMGYGSVVRTTTAPNINYQWGSGSVMGGPSDRVQVKFEGNITSDTTGNIQFYAPGDDGVRLYVDNTLIINDWRDKGGGGSQSAPVSFTANVPKPITLWFYENGGGAAVWLYWYKQGLSGYTIVPTSALSRGAVDPALAAAVTSAQGTLQVSQATLDSLLAVQSSAQADASSAYSNYMAANQAMAVAESEQAPIQQAAWDTRAAVQTTQAAIPVAAQAVVDAQAAYDAKLAERNAAWDAYTATYHALNAGYNAVATASAAYDQAQQDLAVAQQNLTAAQDSLTAANTNLTNTIDTANQLADTAVVKSLEAKSALETATTTVSIAATLYTAEQIRLQAQRDAEAAAQRAAQQAAAYVPPAPPVAEPAPLPEPVEQPAPTPEPSPEPSLDPQPTPDPQPAPEPAPEPQPAPEPAPAPQPTPEPAPAPAPAPEPAPAPAPAPEPPAVIVVTKDTTAETWKPAVAPETYMKPAEIQAFKEIGIVPNNPTQLPTDVPKPAPVEALVPHEQVDVKGVENGGIQFFGTKDAPQVVNEDGTLTPPAPAPGSGDPIPPDAITTTDTFIGQPGGTTFNAPDIAVPVVLVPVEVPAALDVIPGAGAAIQVANQAYVALANIGNDMSPITRKKAKKILVLTTVITAVRRRFGS